MWRGHLPVGLALSKLLCLGTLRATAIQRDCAHWLQLMDPFSVGRAARRLAQFSPGAQSGFMPCGAQGTLQGTAEGRLHVTGQSQLG